MSTPASSSFPRTRAAVGAIGAVLATPASTGSTNADVLAAAPDQPHGSVLVTLDQTAGRGRLDRTWTAPAGQALAASVLVRADLDDRDRGWLPLVAGAAMRDAVAAVLGDASDDEATDADDATDVDEANSAVQVPSTTDATVVAGASRASRPQPRVTVKWPNDVLLDGRKVCGILCQVAADGSVVVGAGVNLTIPAHRLPTPTSTSLTVAGAAGDAAGLADAVLSVFHRLCLEAVAALATGGAAAETVRSHVRSACGTIGQRVRLELPDGTVEEAEATGIDDDGRITIRDRQGILRGVAVGDVTHLRYA